MRLVSCLAVATITSATLFGTGCAVESEADETSAAEVSKSSGLTANEAVALRRSFDLGIQYYKTTAAIGAGNLDQAFTTFVQGAHIMGPYELGLTATVRLDKIYFARKKAGAAESQNGPLRSEKARARRSFIVIADETSIRCRSTQRRNTC